MAGRYTVTQPTRTTGMAAKKSRMECCLMNTVEAQIISAKTAKKTVQQGVRNFFVLWEQRNTAKAPMQCRDGHTLVLESTV